MEYTAPPWSQSTRQHQAAPLGAGPLEPEAPVLVWTVPPPTIKGDAPHCETNQGRGTLLPPPTSQGGRSCATDINLDWGRAEVMFGNITDGPQFYINPFSILTGV